MIGEVVLGDATDVRPGYMDGSGKCLRPLGAGISISTCGPRGCLETPSTPGRCKNDGDRAEKLVRGPNSPACFIGWDGLDSRRMRFGSCWFKGPGALLPPAIIPLPVPTAPVLGLPFMASPKPEGATEYPRPLLPPLLLPSLPLEEASYTGSIEEGGLCALCCDVACDG
jgi:hypothetical protein